MKYGPKALRKWLSLPILELLSLHFPLANIQHPSLNTKMPNTQLSKLQSLLRMESRSREYNGRPEISMSGTSTASSSTAVSSSRRERVPGFTPKLRLHSHSKTEPVRRFCLPSCPIQEDDMHATGLYLHQEKTSRRLSFLFGAQNPPPEIWVAHNKLMKGVASEEDEDLVLTFLAHHPFKVGNVTDKTFWRTSEEAALLTMVGHPLSFIDPETTSQSFIPIRVSPIKQAE